MAAVAAEMATFPLDTAKTRQQIQGHSPHLDHYWQGEGLTSIYRGLSPALVRQSV